MNRHFFDDPEIRLKDVASPIPLLISAGGVGVGGGGGGIGVLHTSESPVILETGGGGGADGFEDVSIVTSASRLSYSSEDLPERDDPVSTPMQCLNYLQYCMKF